MSQKLLALPEEEQYEFIMKNATHELIRLSTIVAMETVRRTASTSSVVSYIVLAAETGEVIILDPQGFTVLHHVMSFGLKSSDRQKIKFVCVRL